MAKEHYDLPVDQYLSVAITALQSLDETGELDTDAPPA
jgi:hypothetical protein